MAGTEILSKIGVGSGLNTTEIIEALVEADSAAQKESLDRLEENNKAKISAFATLKSNLKDFKDIISEIKNGQQYGYVGITSDATVATITTSGKKAGATIDSSLTVTTLATQHTLTGPTYSALTSTVGSGTLTIDFGTWNSDPSDAGGQTHTSNGQDQISIDTTSATTLIELRDSINNAATDSDDDGTKDVLASIIYDGTNYMLMLKSESGASNEMKVTGSSNLATEVGGVSYNYQAGNSDMTQRVAGINSAFTVDGISMTRTSNSIDDLFDGFTLDLKKTSSSAIRIASKVDLDGVKDLVEGYVMTYNEVQESIRMMSLNDDIEDNDGALIGDSTLREIQQQLRSMTSKAIKGYEGGPYYLSNLGIKTERDGSLTFNSKTLEEQFNYNSEIVRAFFSNNLTTNNTNLAVTAYSWTETQPGSYAFVTNGSNSHTIGGVAASKSGSTFTVASGDPKGIVATYSPSGSANYTIYYGKSFLDLVKDKLDVYLKFNSIIDTRISNLNESLSTVAEKKIQLEDRMEKLTQRYARQYSSMESSIASFQETGNMLTAMLETNKD